MSTLRTTSIIHGSSAVDNIVLDNQGRAIFGPNSPAGRAALYVNAQLNRVGVNTESPGVELDVTGQISSTGNAAIGGTLNVTGDFSVASSVLFVDADKGSVGINTTTFNAESAGRNILELAGGAGGALFNLTTQGTRRGYLFGGNPNVFLYNVGNGYIDFGTNNISHTKIFSDGQTIIASNQAAPGSVYTQATDTTLQLIDPTVAKLNLYVPGERGYSMRVDSSDTLIIRDDSGSTDLVTINATGSPSSVSLVGDLYVTDKVFIGNSSITTFQLQVRGSGLQQAIVGSTNAGGAALVLDGAANGDGSGSDYAMVTHTAGGQLIFDTFNTGGDIIARASASNANIISRIGSTNMLLVQSTRVRTNGIVTVNSDDSGMDFNASAGTLELKVGGATIAECNSGQLVPGNDNTIDLGSAGRRWEEVFSAIGAINTSDATQKQSIETLEDKEVKVAKKVKGLIRKYRMNDAVEKKGDEARIHIGIVAQDLKAAFESEGLVAEKYSMFCSDTWEEEGVSKTRLGVRYSELFAFMLAAL